MHPLSSLWLPNIQLPSSLFPQLWKGTGQLQSTEQPQVFLSSSKTKQTQPQLRIPPGVSAHPGAVSAITLIQDGEYRLNNLIVNSYQMWLSSLSRTLGLKHGPRGYGANLHLYGRTNPSSRGGMIFFRSLKEASATFLDDTVEVIQLSEIILQSRPCETSLLEDILYEFLGLLHIYGRNCESLNVTLCFMCSAHGDSYSSHLCNPKPSLLQPPNHFLPHHLQSLFTL